MVGKGPLFRCVGGRNVPALGGLAHEPIAGKKGGPPMPSLAEDELDEIVGTAFKGADLSPETHAIMRKNSDGKPVKAGFIPDHVLAQCEPLHSNMNAAMGGVSIVPAFVATITVPATVLFPILLALVLKVFDFGDDLTPYCGNEAREQRSQCVILSYSATIRDPK